jgi:competence protein ComEA
MLKKFLAVVAFLYASLSFAAVDVNKGTAAELDGIKGIGPAMSGKIVEERKKGSFKDWNDFIERIKGIGEGNASKLSAEGLTVNGSSYKGAAPAAKKDDKPAKADDKKADAKAKAADDKKSEPKAKADDKKADAKVKAEDKKADAKEDKKAKKDADKKDGEKKEKSDKKDAKADKKDEKKDDKKDAKASDKK